MHAGWAFVWGELSGLIVGAGSALWFANRAYNRLVPQLIAELQQEENTP